MYYKQNLLILLVFTLPLQKIITLHERFWKYRFTYCFYPQAKVWDSNTVYLAYVAILYYIIVESWFLDEKFIFL